eukprot:6139993-Pleurochrysis_carterae.AAC.2
MDSQWPISNEAASAALEWCSGRNAEVTRVSLLTADMDSQDRASGVNMQSLKKQVAADNLVRDEGSM